METVMIIAIGKAGGNIANAIRKETDCPELQNARYIFADTDFDDKKIHEGFGERIVLLEDESFPADVFNDVEKLIIIAGFGGKTGTRFAFLAAKAAKIAGVDQINVVATFPLLMEGRERADQAACGLRQIGDIDGVKVEVFNNETIVEENPNLLFFDIFREADMKIMTIVESAVSNNAPVPSCSDSPLPKEGKRASTMYVFSTLKRFKASVRDFVMQHSKDVSKVVIYIFNCKGLFNPSFSQACMGLQLRKPVRIFEIDQELAPPSISSGDIIIDAIADDPDLQPLRGGFLVLNRWILGQRAIIHRI